MLTQSYITAGRSSPARVDTHRPGLPEGWVSSVQSVLGPVQDTHRMLERRGNRTRWVSSAASGTCQVLVRVPTWLPWAPRVVCIQASNHSYHLTELGLRNEALISAPVASHCPKPALRRGDDRSVSTCQGCRCSAESLLDRRGDFPAIESGFSVAALLPLDRGEFGYSSVAVDRRSELKLSAVRGACLGSLTAVQLDLFAQVGVYASRHTRFLVDPPE